MLISCLDLAGDISLPRVDSVESICINGCPNALLKVFLHESLGDLVRVFPFLIESKLAFVFWLVTWLLILAESCEIMKFVCSKPHKKLNYWENLQPCRACIKISICHANVHFSFLYASSQASCQRLPHVLPDSLETWLPSYNYPHKGATLTHPLWWFRWSNCNWLWLWSRVCSGLPGPRRQIEPL